MIDSEYCTSASFRTAELRYAELARHSWGTALLRAWQLGADTIVAPVPAAWHVSPPGEFDLDGHTHPQRDLAGLVRECARLGFALVIQLDLASSAPAGEPRAWLAALTQALAAQQAPHGPIRALQLAADDWGWAEWLRAAGWQLPIVATHGGAGLRLGYGGTPGVVAAARTPVLMRSDGSVRPAFWRAKMLRMLLGAHDGFAAARAPADLALLTDRPLAQSSALYALLNQLRDASVTFDILDIAAATSEQLAAYTLVVAPAELTTHPLAGRILAPAANLTLLGDTAGDLAEGFFYKPRLAGNVAAEQLYETLETLGGNVSYAWADGPGITLNLRYGAQQIYLFVQNHQPNGYSGMLAYRAPDGAVLHLHLGIAGGRSGVVVLRDDEVLGAALDGDGAEGGWLARGLRTSMVFSTGAGGMVAYGDALVATAPQSGRFQIRHASAWGDMQAYRLLLSGAPLPAPIQREAAHLIVPYVAEDEQGQTDCYLVVPVAAALPEWLRTYLAGLLHARAAVLRGAAMLARRHGAMVPAGTLDAIAEGLAPAELPLTTLADYALAWHTAASQATCAIEALVAADAGHLAATIAELLDSA